MEMTGEQLIALPQQATWDALNDTTVLMACIPGCKAIRRNAADRRQSRRHREKVTTPDGNGQHADGQMPFTSHLGELRSRLVKSVLAVAVQTPPSLAGAWAVTLSWRPSKAQTPCREERDTTSGGGFGDSRNDSGNRRFPSIRCFIPVAPNP